jgi:LysM repeat protein
MRYSNRFFISSFGACLAAAVLSGCATGQKNMQPVSETQKSEFVKQMDTVQEQPALEPEWADWVKDHYPNWRQHYWVDRGQWGNRGYIFGKPPAEAEPPVEAQVTPLPPVAQAPVIEENAPPKIEEAEKPTRYVVKRGDSLWRIAGKVYGNPLKWPRIYHANKDKIKNPNRIFANQVLFIPQD